MVRFTTRRVDDTELRLLDPGPASPTESLPRRPLKSIDAQRGKLCEAYTPQSALASASERTISTQEETLAAPGPLPWENSGEPRLKTWSALRSTSALAGSTSRRHSTKRRAALGACSPRGLSLLASGARPTIRHPGPRSARLTSAFSARLRSCFNAWPVGGGGQPEQRYDAGTRACSWWPGSLSLSVDDTL